MTRHLVSWTGVDDPSRVDLASIDLGSTSMRAIGGSRALDFSSSWELEVADGWITRALRVTTRGFGWGRMLELTRSRSGTWAAEATSWGDDDMAPPGLEDPARLDGAVDCDLGLCPVTNTMPIRRLGLLDGDLACTNLVMAWVEMPSLRVLRSDQAYASGASAGLVNYASADGSFRAELTVDADGLVIDYPDLARRERASSH
ncbi:putative glycolipid-binding domain-containing protein [Demequina muriae]|uniref:Glycolipid-binding domain-containing protein n=1 Tax=Demequina muriae TaxID=3051664 RepID=A0ABT8GFM3_9MICO|nr:putative glycolipid-binding domain-containing protein [Demequina sp. EGI L300058]MDN4480236.1 putative glycolipid-binding domain-containing protein [Demequina sp. EGI L300058]